MSADKSVQQSPSTSSTSSSLPTDNLHYSTSNNPRSPSSCPFKPILSPVKSVHHCPWSPSPDLPTGDADPHRFIPPIPSSSRAPCPALNALANHGYLPRSGKQITFQDIIYAMQEGFGLSSEFSLFMAAGSFTLMKRWFGNPFNLQDIAIHGLIEHSVSLIHDDVDMNKKFFCADEDKMASFAPNHVDPVILRRFMKIAYPLHPGGELHSAAHIAQYRVERESESKISDFFHQLISGAEFIMIVQIFGKEADNGSGKWCVDEKVITDVFMKQCFPEGWRPQRVLHLSDAIRCTNDIRHCMENIRKIQHKKKAGMGDHEWFCHVRQWFNNIVNIPLEH